MPIRRVAPVYEDHYRSAPAPRTPPPPSGNTSAASLGQTGYLQGRERGEAGRFCLSGRGICNFPCMGPIETYRQARTHLRGVALANIRHAPLPPRTWEELKDLLMRRFQPRDLTSTFKAQFRARRRQRNEDIHIYVDTPQKLAEMAWP